MTQAFGRYSIAALLVGGLSSTALAQGTSYECDDSYGECGTPEESGGGCGCGGGSILINNTDLGDTYQYADDYDNDGVEDPYDNCPFIGNSDQVDDDGDGIGSNCDNCPSLDNALQEDIDGDLLGNDCDDDMDGDQVLNGTDLCELNPDTLQKDTDTDGAGDACDDDMDADGVANLEDNCPLVFNPDQADDDPDVFGTACDDDDDGDGIRNTYDNCLIVANETQVDLDLDSIGDACDADVDGDGPVNLMDNCQQVPNSDQADDDRDGVGEVCDDRYCYVVDGDVDNCLDPTLAFSVYSPDAVAKVGKETRLRLFANRINQPIRYTWEVVEAPKRSKVTVANATGAANVSTPYEYHYQSDRSVTFTPDEPGTYKIRLHGELVWADEVTGAMGQSAETTMTFEATGEAKGCSTTGSSESLLGMAVLGLVAAGASRRRR